MTNDGGRERPGDTDLPDDDERTTLPPPERVIETIAAGRVPEYDHLRALANPTDSIVARMLALWPRVEPERRRELLARLHQLADEDATLDFHRIHLSALRDTDPATRILAVRGLWDQERTDYLTLLTRQLREDPEASVRAEIADALGRWVISLEFGLLSEDDGEELTAALRDAVEDIEEQDEVRARALEALGA
jgi:HEAT repeats